MLIISTQNNQLALCKYLVELGADLNARNAKGNTALHFSVTYDMLELSRFLVSMGADEYATNSDGLTCYEGLSLDDLENL
jgi:ankyrin repeat protein